MEGGASGHSSTLSYHRESLTSQSVTSCTRISCTPVLQPFPSSAAPRLLPSNWSTTAPHWAHRAAALSPLRLTYSFWNRTSSSGHPDLISLKRFNRTALLKELQLPLHKAPSVRPALGFSTGDQHPGDLARHAEHPKLRGWGPAICV